jgi:hypothetical protein
MSSSRTRIDSLDVARGALLTAMLVVHVISAHATANQAAWMHAWTGIFLVSSGFVTLSGFVIGSRNGTLNRGDWVRAVDAFCHLVLVMVVYAVLLSLARHELARIGRGPASCDARLGWVPPHRFEDLGILLPIALVQLLGPMARGRARWSVPVTLAVALGWTLLPAATSTWQGNGIRSLFLGVLARRSLTPFYTVGTFVGLGLTGILLGRIPWAAVRRGQASPVSSMVALMLSVVLATPACSRTLLNPLYGHLGDLGGSAATLAYWILAVALFLRGFAAPIGTASGALRHSLALLGRNSLLVFIAHDFLLELDAFARVHGGFSKGIPAAATMIAVDVMLLVFLCRWVERGWRIRALVSMLLLNRSHNPIFPRTGAFTLYGGLAFACVFAAYTSNALARPHADILIDDFESEECPPWWTFGGLAETRVPFESNAGHPAGYYLQVRGEASPAAAGRGLYLQRDIADRRHLVVDVRGYGPDSGRIKIELDDDDNGNWEIEKSLRTFMPLYDDRFSHQLTVDWHGWRRVTVPVEAFRDDNPAVGDNVFNPIRDLGSGGLLEMQLLFASSGNGTPIRIDLDNLRWTP